MSQGREQIGGRKSRCNNKHGRKGQYRAKRERLAKAKKKRTEQAHSDGKSKRRGELL